MCDIHQTCVGVAQSWMSKCAPGSTFNSAWVCVSVGSSRCPSVPAESRWHDREGRCGRFMLPEILCAESPLHFSKASALTCVTHCRRWQLIFTSHFFTGSRTSVGGFAKTDSWLSPIFIGRNTNLWWSLGTKLNTVGQQQDQKQQHVRAPQHFKECDDRTHNISGNTSTKSTEKDMQTQETNKKRHNISAINQKNQEEKNSETNLLCCCVFLKCCQIMSFREKKNQSYSFSLFSC